MISLNGKFYLEVKDKRQLMQLNENILLGLRESLNILRT